MTLQQSLLMTLILQNTPSHLPGLPGPARGLPGALSDLSLEERYIRRNRRVRRAFWRPRTG